MRAEPTFTFYSFFKHLFRSKGRHGVHSPFVYSLIENVIFPSKKKGIESIDQILKRHLQDDASMVLQDFKTNEVHHTKVSSIARRSTSSRRFRSFLGLLARHLETKSILETGTSLGFTSAYLAEMNPEAKVHTLEANHKLFDHNQKTWKEYDNLILHKGLIQEHFETLIDRIRPDLIFLDADHRGSVVEWCVDVVKRQQYQPKAIIIHDIYWSRDMNQSWKSVSKAFPIAVDVFQAGILFPQIDTSHQYFYLKF